MWKLLLHRPSTNSFLEYTIECEKEDLDNKISDLLTNMNVKKSAWVVLDVSSLDEKEKKNEC